MAVARHCIGFSRHPPVIDGMPDALWYQATAMTINVAGGANTGAQTVTLKSVYTDDSVYFHATWNCGG
jgi:hypothetical protein